MSKINLNLRTEIDEETFAVRVWYPDSEAPNLLQPWWPDGTPWASKEEAQEWADLYIQALEDSEAPYAPISPGEPGEPKPVVTN